MFEGGRMKDIHAISVISFHYFKSRTKVTSTARKCVDVDLRYHRGGPLSHSLWVCGLSYCGLSLLFIYFFYKKRAEKQPAYFQRIKLLMKLTRWQSKPWCLAMSWGSYCTVTDIWCSSLPFSHSFIHLFIPFKYTNPLLMNKTLSFRVL